VQQEFTTGKQPQLAPATQMIGSAEETGIRQLMSMESSRPLSIAAKELH